MGKYASQFCELKMEQLQANNNKREMATQAWLVLYLVTLLAVSLNTAVVRTPENLCLLFRVV